MNIRVRASWTRRALVLAVVPAAGALACAGITNAAPPRPGVAMIQVVEAQPVCDDSGEQSETVPGVQPLCGAPDEQPGVVVIPGIQSGSAVPGAQPGITPIDAAR
ncbi:hypothetical protein ACFVVM_02755 [Nocardia sp. NPDC058176]|uniref:hypothetical protein n=1 Tax=Nocardia sp. NPDC058176 TaxID=3346368 RepID=UPI0036DB842E